MHFTIKTDSEFDSETTKYKTVKDAQIAALKAIIFDVLEGTQITITKHLKDGATEEVETYPITKKVDARTILEFMYNNQWMNTQPSTPMIKALTKLLAEG